MKYITFKIRADRVFHGYDEHRKPIKDPVTPDKGFVEKVIKIDRILSFTEDHIFIECPHDTVQTWQYEGGLQEVKERLREGGLLIE